MAPKYDEYGNLIPDSKVVPIENLNTGGAIATGYGIPPKAEAYTNSGIPGVSAIQDRATVNKTFGIIPGGIPAPQDLPAVAPAQYVAPRSVEAPINPTIPAEWSAAYTKALDAIGATTDGIKYRAQIQSLSGLLDNYQKMHSAISVPAAQNFQTAVTQRGQDVTAAVDQPLRAATANKLATDTLYEPLRLALEADKTAAQRYGFALGKQAQMHDNELKYMIPYMSNIERMAMEQFPINTPEGYRQYQQFMATNFPLRWNELLKARDTLRSAYEGPPSAIPLSGQRTPALPAPKSPAEVELERRRKQRQKPTIAGSPRG